MPTLVSDRARTQLASIFKRQSGSYMVVGPAASGKFTAVLELAKAKTGNPVNLIIIEPDGESIKIEQIHRLTRQLQFKEVEVGKRVVIIRDGDKLTREAQNAFLKTLEEPPVDTLVILTATAKGQLLPTILSRCQVVEFVPPTQAAIQQWLKSQLKLSAAEVSDLVELGNGAIGQAISMAQDDHLRAEQKLLNDATAAFLSQSDVYARLKVVLNLEGQINTLTLIESLTGALQKRLQESIAASDNLTTKQTLDQLKVCQAMHSYLSAHGNAKLALIYIALNL